MAIKRSDKIHNLVEELRKIKYFPGSTIDQWEKTDYMSDEDVKSEAKKYAERLKSLRDWSKKLSESNKCGELTSYEKQILIILEREGY